MLTPSLCGWYTKGMALTFPVSEEKNRLLRQRMEALGVREEDIEETFIRSSGHGGQHVNKTSTCVRLLHRPSGIEVKCMRERSQAMNRYLARRELLARLEGTSGPSARDAAIEKERKRKAKRRSRSSKKYSSEGESQ